MPKPIFTDNKAFTLAEVLITLTIIGVIAALTIPTLMKNIQEHAWHQQWKDNYSMLSNAFKMVVAEDPDIVVSQQNSYYMTIEFINKFLSKLKIEDSCNYSLTAGVGERQCEYHGNRNSKTKWSGIGGNVGSTYKSLAGGPINGYDFYNKAALLKNGASIYFGGLWSGLTIVVDVNNASKGPNILGKDVYALNLVNIDQPARPAYSLYTIERIAKDMIIQPYGAPNKQDYDGLAGCSADIGQQEGNINVLASAPGAGCSYKYLYEK